MQRSPVISKADALKGTFFYFCYTLKTGVSVCTNSFPILMHNPPVISNGDAYALTYFRSVCIPGTFFPYLMQA